MSMRRRMPGRARFCWRFSVGAPCAQIQRKRLQLRCQVHRPHHSRRRELQIPLKRIWQGISCHGANPTKLRPIDVPVFCCGAGFYATELEKNKRLEFADQSIFRTGFTSILNAGSVALTISAFKLASSSAVTLSRPPISMAIMSILGCLTRHSSKATVSNNIRVER
jgi:hypothetical protein